MLLCFLWCVCVCLEKPSLITGVMLIELSEAFEMRWPKSKSLHWKAFPPLGLRPGIRSTPKWNSRQPLVYKVMVVWRSWACAQRHTEKVTLGYLTTPCILNSGSPWVGPLAGPVGIFRYVSLIRRLRHQHFYIQEFIPRNKNPSKGPFSHLWGNLCISCVFCPPSKGRASKDYILWHFAPACKQNTCFL